MPTILLIWAMLAFSFNAFSFSPISSSNGWSTTANGFSGLVILSRKKNEFEKLQLNREVALTRARGCEISLRLDRENEDRIIKFWQGRFQKFRKFPCGVFGIQSLLLEGFRIELVVILPPCHGSSDCFESDVKLFEGFRMIKVHLLHSAFIPPAPLERITKKSTLRSIRNAPQTKDVISGLLLIAISTTLAYISKLRTILTSLSLYRHFLRSFSACASRASFRTVSGSDRSSGSDHPFLSFASFHASSHALRDGQLSDHEWGIVAYLFRGFGSFSVSGSTASRDIAMELSYERRPADGSASDRFRGSIYPTTSGVPAGAGSKVALLDTPEGHRASAAGT
jgi:hypothetical protein